MNELLQNLLKLQAIEFEETTEKNAGDDHRGVARQNPAANPRPLRPPGRPGQERRDGHSRRELLQLPHPRAHRGHHDLETRRGHPALRKLRALSLSAGRRKRNAAGRRSEARKKDPRDKTRLHPLNDPSPGVKCSPCLTAFQGSGSSFLREVAQVLQLDGKVDVVDHHFFRHGKHDRRKIQNAGDAAGNEPVRHFLRGGGGHGENRHLDVCSGQIPAVRPCR